MLVWDTREGGNRELNRSNAKVSPEKRRDETLSMCSDTHGRKPGHSGSLPRLLILIIFYPIFKVFLDLKDRVPLMKVWSRRH